MDHAAPRVSHPRIGRLAVVAMAALLLVAACGGAAGSGGGGGGADPDKIIAETQVAFGTSMVGGTVEGDTITITIIDGFGAAGAKLFMCSNVKNSMAKHDPNGTLTVVMVDESGNQLAASADCK